MTEPMADAPIRRIEMAPAPRLRPLHRTRKLLHWLGLENEHGLFSWRGVLLALAVAAFLTQGTVWAFAFMVLALINHQIEGYRSQTRNRIAMETTSDQVRTKMNCEAQVMTAQIQGEVEKAKVEAAKADSEMRKEVAELTKRVNLLLTPERISKLEEIYKRKLGV